MISLLGIVMIAAQAIVPMSAFHSVMRSKKHHNKKNKIPHLTKINQKKKKKRVKKSKSAERGNPVRGVALVTTSTPVSQPNLASLVSPAKAAPAQVAPALERTRIDGEKPSLASGNRLIKSEAAGWGKSVPHTNTSKKRQSGLDFLHSASDPKAKIVKADAAEHLFDKYLEPGANNSQISRETSGEFERAFFGGGSVEKGKKRKSRGKDGVLRNDVPIEFLNSAGIIFCGLPIAATDSEGNSSRMLNDAIIEANSFKCSYSRRSDGGEELRPGKKRVRLLDDSLRKVEEQNSEDLSKLAYYFGNTSSIEQELSVSSKTRNPDQVLGTSVIEQLPILNKRDYIELTDEMNRVEIDDGDVLLETFQGGGHLSENMFGDWAGEGYLLNGCSTPRFGGGPHLKENCEFTNEGLECLKLFNEVLEESKKTNIVDIVIVGCADREKYENFRRHCFHVSNELTKILNRPIEELNCCEIIDSFVEKTQSLKKVWGTLSRSFRERELFDCFGKNLKDIDCMASDLLRAHIDKNTKNIECYALYKL